ncbi:hypothetical protein CYMTET_50913, partial [Cymbomonas tetramitiformis]
DPGPRIPLVLPVPWRQLELQESPNARRAGGKWHASLAVTPGFIRVQLDDGRSVAVKIAGESFGETELAQGPGAKHESTAKAVESTELFAFNYTTYMNVVEGMRKQVIDARIERLGALPLLNVLTQTQAGQEVLYNLAVSAIERTIAKGAVLMKQGEEGETNYFYAVKSGSIKVIRMIDLPKYDDKIKENVEEAPAALSAVTPFPAPKCSSYQVNAAVKEPLPVLRGLTVQEKRKGPPLAESLSCSSFDSPQPFATSASPTKKSPPPSSHQSTPPFGRLASSARHGRSSPTSTATTSATGGSQSSSRHSSKHYYSHRNNMFAWCDSHKVESVPLEIDELTSGSCFVRSRFIKTSRTARENNTCAVASMIATHKSVVFVLSKWDFIRHLLPFGEDPGMPLAEANMQVDAYTDNDAHLWEWTEGEHWEKYKAEMVSDVYGSRAKRSSNPRTTTPLPMASIGQVGSSSVVMMDRQYWPENRRKPAKSASFELPALEPTGRHSVEVGVREGVARARGTGEGLRGTSDKTHSSAGFRHPYGSGEGRSLPDLGKDRHHRKCILVHGFHATQKRSYNRHRNSPSKSPDVIAQPEYTVQPHSHVHTLAELSRSPPKSSRGRPESSFWWTEVAFRNLT